MLLAGLLICLILLKPARLLVVRLGIMLFCSQPVLLTLTSQIKSRQQLAMQVWESVKRVIWSGLLVNGLAASGLLPNPVRVALLRLCGIRVMTSTVHSGCHFTDPNVTIGSNTFISHNCFFDAAAPIRIGQRCGIGMESLFCTSTHRIGAPAHGAG